MSEEQSASGGSEFVRLSKSEKKRLRKEAEAERKRDRKTQRFGADLWVDAGTAEYVIDPICGLRHVVPHVYLFTAFAKQRWYGRALIDVLADEFMAYSKEYYDAAIANGKIKVNDVIVSSGYLLKNGDRVTHLVHRHEPAVSSSEIQIWEKDESQIVLISKPSSIPIHPCGKYHFNSLVYIIAKEFGLHCHAVHRLDRLTSGLCILAKDAPTARLISQQIRERNVEKYYLARVTGKFPDGESELHDLQNCMNSGVLEGYIDNCGKKSKEIVVEEPIYCVSQRLSKHAVPDKNDAAALEKARECKSVFKLLSYNGNTSMVLCRPFTGRTHQLRVHLQWLGHPIANDPNYGGVICSGNSRAPSELSGYEFLSKNEKVKSDPNCWECDQEKGMQIALKKPNLVYCTEIWLHALRYSSADWSYEVSPPKWASLEYNCSDYLKLPANAELFTPDMEENNEFEE